MVAVLERMARIAEYPRRRILFRRTAVEATFFGTEKAKRLNPVVSPAFFTRIRKKVEWMSRPVFITSLNRDTDSRCELGNIVNEIKT